MQSAKAKFRMPSLPDHKSFKSALVLVPPDHQMVHVDRIRETHDRRFNRWMAHITLVFPFIPTDTSFARQEQILQTVRHSLKTLGPFQLSFDRFDYFKHSSRSFTLYLAPGAHARERLQHLVQTLAHALPEYDDVRKNDIFTPHLTLGQFKSLKELKIFTSKHQDLVESSGQISSLVQDIAWVTRANYADRMRVSEQFFLRG